MSILSRVPASVIKDVRRGIGRGARIGYAFLYAGTGYGNSCFSKDVQALIRTADEHGTPLWLLAAVAAVNVGQKTTLAREERAA